MIKKDFEKTIALNLRKRGGSYREILEVVPVAKSTLSLWLRSVGLSQKQKQRLTQKKLMAARRGALKRKEDRISRTKIIKEISERQIGALSDRERWLIGIALYWAEGSKEKDWHPSQRTQFINSDPKMVKFFISWLVDRCKILKDMLIFDIYLHESHQGRRNSVIDYWAKETGYPKQVFKHIYYKRNKLSTKRKNVGDTYFGILKINIQRSSSFNRQIAGWIEGIVKA